jgi:Cupin-like domain
MTSSIKRFSFDLLWLAEHLFDSRVTNSILQRGRRSILHSLIDSDVKELKLSSVKQNTEVQYLDHTNFHRIISSEPCLFPGLGKSTDSFQKWNFDYLERNYGHIQQSSYARINGDYNMKSLKEVIANIKNPTRQESITFGDLRYQSEQASQEMSYKNFMDQSLIENKFNHYQQLFLAHKGYFNGYHSEMVNSITLQVRGVKRWVVIDPRDSLFLDPVVSRMLHFPCSLEIDTAILKNLPQKPIRGYVVDLHPGDVFYLPPFFWHAVEYLEDAISIGCFWSEIKTVFRHPLLSFMILTSRNPSILQQLIRRGQNSYLTYGIKK